MGMLDELRIPGRTRRGNHESRVFGIIKRLRIWILKRSWTCHEQLLN